MTRPEIDTAGVTESVELDRNECFGLLAAKDVGRVVFTEAAMPAAHPVNYLLDGEEVLFRTADGRAFTAIRHAVVGFQIDEMDRTTRTGWSVLGVGHAYEVTDPVRLTDLGERLPRTWAPRRSAHVVAVPMRHLTGRRLVRTDGGR